MLKVSYIASSVPMEKPQKLSKKERLHNAAVETLAVRRHEDRLKALAMFAEEEAEIRALELKYEQILINKNLK